MKKKFLLVGSTLALAGLAVVGLAGCSGSATDDSGSGASGSGAASGSVKSRTKVTRNQNGLIKDTFDYIEAPAAPTYSTDGGRLDVFVNYSGTGGIRRVADGSWTDTVNGETYTKAASDNTDKLLPTWTAFASYTKTTIIDASDYSQNSDNNVWTAVASGDSIMSQTDTTQNVDLIYNSTSNLRNNVGKLTDLTEYINNGTMPNFKAWLEKNPTVKKMLQVGDAIYFTPYFDGMNDIERMFIMDTAMTTKVLDSESGWDTTTTNGGASPSANVLQGGYYTPFVDETYNYPDAETTVDIMFNGSDTDADGNEYKLVIKQTTNIIKQQNELLAKGCTGAELADQFIKYIKEAYADAFDAGYYDKPSDLFLTDSAAYNADDLVALMRVVKANPGMITGDAAAEIETFFPRAASNNRIENIYDLAQIWGVQGVDGEQNNFYFAGDGKIHAVETTTASYEALTYLSEMYDEGLILQDFYTNASGKASGNDDLKKYYMKSGSDVGYGFMMYDYSASTCAANDAYNGVGTDPSTRNEAFQNTAITSITAVTAPLTYWATESNWDHTEHITDKTGKTLCRYYESNRALKTNTWAIPANSDNKEGAARLMDFMFSELGQDVNNYGPTDHWATPSTSLGDTVNGSATATVDSTKAYVATDLVAGENSPIISNQVKTLLRNSNGQDFWTFMRNNLGATHGIGNIRPKGVNLQATNAYAQNGVSQVQSEFANDRVLKLAMIDKHADFAWDSSVPTGYVSTFSDSGNVLAAINGFWGTSKFGNNNGWVQVITAKYDADKTDLTVYGTDKANYTYQNVLDQFDAFNNKSLRTYAMSVGAAYTPAYALVTE